MIARRLIARRLIALAGSLAATALIVGGVTAPASAESPTVPEQALPTAQLNGVAYAQVVTHGTVYVGGLFTTARPAGADPGEDTVRRTNLLAYDLATGRLKSWAPRTNGVVRGLAASRDGSTVYAVGSFTEVNGKDRGHIVALDAASGRLRTRFHPDLNATAYAVDVSHHKVYAGGIFTSVDGVTRVRAASFDRETGELQPWAPEVDDTVNAVLVSPTARSVVLGGRFSHVNGRTAYGSARVGGRTGETVLSWPVNRLIGNHGDDSGITALAGDGKNVYASGYAYQADIPQKRIEGAYSVSWQGKLRWIEDCHGDTYSIAPSSTAVYIAGHPHDCRNVPNGFVGKANDGVYHRALAFTKDAKGTLDTNTVSTNRYSDFGGEPAPRQYDWMPDFNTGTATGLNQGPWSVAVSGDWVVYAGEFTEVNGQGQQGMVRFHR